MLTHTLGTLLRLLTDARMGRTWSEDVGVPLAAGLIVGEALVGVFYASYKARVFQALFELVA